MRRKWDDEQHALVVKPRPISLSHLLPNAHAVKATPKSFPLAPLGRVCMLFGILAGLGASAYLYFIMPLPQVCVVWIIHAVLALFYGMDMIINDPSARRLLVCAWAPVAMPMMVLWRVGKWIGTGK